MSRFDMARSFSKRSVNNSNPTHSGDNTKIEFYIKNGVCPTHPDIQLRKKKLLGFGWKTLLRECPRCAALFVAQTHGFHYAATTGPSSIPPGLAMGVPLMSGTASELSCDESQAPIMAEPRPASATIKQERDPVDASFRRMVVDNDDDDCRPNPTNNKTTDCTEEILNRIADMIHNNNSNNQGGGGVVNGSAFNNKIVNVDSPPNDQIPDDIAKGAALKKTVPIVQRISAFARPLSFRAIPDHDSSSPTNVEQQQHYRLFNNDKAPSPKMEQQHYQLYETSTSDDNEQSLLSSDDTSPIAALQLNVTNEKQVNVEGVQFQKASLPIPEVQSNLEEPVPKNVPVSLPCVSPAQVTFHFEMDNAFNDSKVEIQEDEEQSFQWNNNKDKETVQTPQLDQMDNSPSYWCGQYTTTTTPPLPSSSSHVAMPPDPISCAALTSEDDNPIKAAELNTTNGKQVNMEDIQFKRAFLPIPAKQSDLREPMPMVKHELPTQVTFHFEMDNGKLLSPMTNSLNHQSLLPQRASTPDVSLADSTTDNSFDDESKEQLEEEEERWTQWNNNNDDKEKLQVPGLNHHHDSPSYWCGQSMTKPPPPSSSRELAVSPDPVSCAALAHPVPSVWHSGASMSQAAMMHCTMMEEDSADWVDPAVCSDGIPSVPVLPVKLLVSAQEDDKSSCSVEDHDYYLPVSNLTQETISICDMSQSVTGSVQEGITITNNSTALTNHVELDETKQIVGSIDVTRYRDSSPPIFQRTHTRDRSLDPVIGPTLSFASECSNNSLLVVETSLTDDDTAVAFPKSPTDQESKDASLSKTIANLRSAEAKECSRLLLKIRKLTLDKDSKQEIAKKGGIQAIVEVMRRHMDSVDVQEQSCGTILCLLCNKNTENKVLFGKNGGIACLLAAMNYHMDSAKLQGAACGVALSMMSANMENVDAFARTGGILVILESMKKHLDDPVVQRRGCGTAWNFLCNNNDNKLSFVQAGGIKCIINAMRAHPDNAGIQEEACGASLSLMSNNKENVNRFAEHGGIHCIVEAMQNHLNNAGVVEQACGAAWNFMCSVENGFHKVAFAAAGGIPTIVMVMRHHVDNASIMEQACGAVRNFMAKSNNNKVAFAKAGGTVCILDALQRHPTSAGVQTQGCGAALSLLLDSNNNKVNFVILGGVDCILTAMKNHSRNEEVTERGCGCLMNLTTSTGVLPISVARETMEILKQASRMFPDNPNIQRWSSESQLAMKKWTFVGGDNH